MHALTDAQWDELQRLVKAAARRVAAQWPEVVERDDLEQDVFLRLVESPGAVDRLFDEQELQVRQSFLIKMAHQLASDQQSSYDRFSGNYLYDSAEVRGYLERQVWLNEDLESAEKLDLSEGLANLAESNSTYYSAIINRFVHEIVPDDAGRMRVGRAVDALTEKMNRIGSTRRRDWIEGPGSRKAVSNSQAMTATTIGWQGDYGDGRR